MIRVQAYREFDTVVWEAFVPNPDERGSVRVQKGTLYGADQDSDEDCLRRVCEAAAHALTDLHSLLRQAEATGR